MTYRQPKETYTFTDWQNKTHTIDRNRFDSLRDIFNLTNYISANSLLKMNKEEKKKIKNKHRSKRYRDRKKFENMLEIDLDGDAELLYKKEYTEKERDYKNAKDDYETNKNAGWDDNHVDFLHNQYKKKEAAFESIGGVIPMTLTTEEKLDTQDTEPIYDLEPITVTNIPGKRKLVDQSGRENIDNTIEIDSITCMLDYILHLIANDINIVKAVSKDVSIKIFLEMYVNLTKRIKEDKSCWQAIQQRRLFAATEIAHLAGKEFQFDDPYSLL